MPSDLEARMFQVSQLPVDVLMHDEVRHTLRRGFFDALDLVAPYPGRDPDGTKRASL